MLSIMEQIVENYSESDVADDALLETALYYQSNDDYEKANRSIPVLLSSSHSGHHFPMVKNSGKSPASSAG